MGRVFSFIAVLLGLFISVFAIATDGQQPLLLVTGVGILLIGVVLLTDSYDGGQ